MELDALEEGHAATCGGTRRQESAASGADRGRRQHLSLVASQCRAREVGNELFIFACKREGKTVKVKFTGLGATDATGAVMFEEPRKVQMNDGVLEDWFAPNDVHVYRIKRTR